MGHSIEDYLRRRTDDELENLWHMYIQKIDDEYYDWLVQMILKIMQERKKKKKQN